MKFLRLIAAAFLIIGLALPTFTFAQTTDTTSTAAPADSTAPAKPAAPAASPSGGTDVSALKVGTPVGNGIFNCNPIGAQSVGSTAATGGTYVPVADATVELNTGYLVYKECVLRPLVDAERQQVTSATLANNLELLAKGRNGNPLWVVNYPKEAANARDQGFIQGFQSSLLSTLNGAFQNQVKTALVRNYQMTTQAPQNALTCPYAGNLQSGYQQPQQNFSYGLIFAMGNPNCDIIYSYLGSQDRLYASAAASEDAWRSQLVNGIYSQRDANGNITVPAVFLGAIGQQSVTSGFRQLENANDIGQMVNSLFAGFGSKLLSSSAGIPSILASNGPDSYVSQMLQQSQNGLLGNISAVAVQNLQQIINWEQQYNDIQGQIASTLTGAIGQLRAAENKCWDLIRSKVCSGTATSTTSGTTCTSSGGATLTIATSTAFSDAAIAKAGLSAIAASIKSSVDTSNQNLITLNSLLAAIESTDVTARNTALANLNTIVNANPPVLHTQSSITTAQDNLTKVQSTVTDTSSGLVSVTLKAWAGDGVDQFGSPQPGAIAWDGSTDPGTGWCNINKQSTLDQWIAKWTH